MTQEEKAKAYDEVIRKLRGMMPNWERLSYNGKTFLQDLIYIIPELAESEDEKVRKALLEMVHDTTGDELWIDYNVHKEEALAWLEKQGDYANFRDKAQVGDRITKNEDGVLVNLSQMKRVAKKNEKQSEQKTEENKGNIGGISANSGWSEEDEKMIESLIESLTRISANTRTDSTSPNYTFYKEIDWLKSLRPQNTWKPSDEQIRALKHAFNDGSITFAEMEILATLYEGLKSFI